MTYTAVWPAIILKLIDNNRAFHVACSMQLIIDVVSVSDEHALRLISWVSRAAGVMACLMKIESHRRKSRTDRDVKDPAIE